MQTTTADPLAFSIAEFCKAHKFSRATWYNLDPKNRPAVMKVNGRNIISRESAAAWRRAREQD